MSDVPRIVAYVTQHGQPAARVIGPVEVRGDGPLAEIGKAIHLSRFAFGFAKRGHKHPGQNGNDRDHDEQFDERESNIGPVSRGLELRCSREVHKLKADHPI